MNKIQTEIKWGFLFFLSGLIWMIFEKSMGMHDQHLEQHANFTIWYAPIAIFLYILALRDKKRSFYQGKMNYLQGFISGLIMTLVVIVLTPLSQYISQEFISPEYFPNIIRLSVEKGQMSQEEAEAHFTLLGYIQQSLIFAAFMGVLTSALVALLTRTRK
jgi:hypothetical protein